MIKTINTNIPYTKINIDIKVDGKNLIIVGDNGSGKTNVLKEIFKTCKSGFHCLPEDVAFNEMKLLFGGEGSFAEYRDKYMSNQFVLSFHDSFDLFDDQPSFVPREFLLKNDFADNLSEYLPNCLFSLFVRKLMLRNEGKEENVMDGVLDDIQRLLIDDSLELYFCANSFSCKIKIDGGEPTSFNNLPSGYLSILSVYANLLLKCFSYNKSKKELEGLVFIDNLGASLSPELQKQFMPFLTELFPKIQFICTTHSVFVLQSMKDTTIYNLSTQTEIKDGFSYYSFESITNSLIFNCSREELLPKAVEEIEKAHKKGNDITVRELRELQSTYIRVINTNKALIENDEVFNKTRDLIAIFRKKEEARELGLSG